jgi:hypothetical protein
MYDAFRINLVTTAGIVPQPDIVQIIDDSLDGVQLVPPTDR